LFVSHAARDWPKGKTVKDAIQIVIQLIKLAITIVLAIKVMEFMNQLSSAK
jgi:hypothetical protein